MERKVDLSCLHKKGCRINWEKSVGDTFSCIYDGEQYNFKIMDYMHIGNPYVYIYNCEDYQGWIFTSDIKQCKFGGILKKINSGFKYELNEIVDNIEIVARRRNPKNGAKEYQIKCLLCGYDMSSDVAYKNKKVFKNKWKLEGNINQGKRCPCCSSQITVPGINDIPTTDSWMVDYFQSGYEEAKFYTKRSGQRIYPKCPDCGRIKTNKISISNIYYNRTIGCICGDHISYPNKFSYALLEQLPVKGIVHEYKPKWAKPYRYDNYFEYNGKKYILEMDGGLGHGNNMQFSNEQIQYELEIDQLKDSLARQHKIQVIRIDCIKSDLDYIKNNIIASDLSNIFDLSNINWEDCDKFAISNLHKTICQDWEKNKEMPNLMQFICNKYAKSNSGIINILKKGTKYNWCSYNAKEQAIKAGHHAAKIQKLKKQKYITCININTNIKTICHATYNQIVEILNLDCSGCYIGKLIQKNRIYKQSMRFSFSTKEEIEYMQNNESKITIQNIRNVDCSWINLAAH